MERAEEWRAVAGYEGLYEVSNLGRVRVIVGQCAGRVFSPSGERYPHVQLRDAARRPKTWNVHRLVLAAFVGPCPVGHVAAHLDGQSRNNRLDNLAWVTQSENNLHKRAHGTAAIGERNSRTRLSADSVRAIRARAAAGESATDTARFFGVYDTTIHQIVKGETWRHVQ